MFRLLSLDLQDIGPFEKAHLDFATEEPRITILTGENGTGKSILLDAIRIGLGSQYAHLSRDIRRTKDWVISLNALFRDRSHNLSASRDSMRGSGQNFSIGGIETVRQVPHGVVHQGHAPEFVADFWSAVALSGPAKIQGLTTIRPVDAFEQPLAGDYESASVVRLLANFDYLRTSELESERKVGERLFSMAKRIVELSLLEDGELVAIRRADFTPIVRQAGREVPLENLSSGNAYLIQRMISLLGKMYSVHVLAGTPPEEIGKTPGFLLIDEAENHLHPKWQKRFLRNILELFPNLQIIAATHSPFIVASVPGARVYVCKYDHEKQRCYVEKQEDVSSRPVDEILMSGVFDETQPFNEEITKLIEERQQAMERGDQEARRVVEAKLLKLNPQHFAYFKVDDMMASLGLR